MQTSGESAVGHLALYDSAAMDVEVNTSSSVQAGQQLLRGCLALHEELRGMDILAARVRVRYLTMRTNCCSVRLNSVP